MDDTGLLALTQAVLLEQLDRNDPAFALRRLVNEAAQHLGRPCGLVALWPDGRQRWTTGSLPDAAVRPGPLLQDRHEAFEAEGWHWLQIGRAHV
jgi:hypothetical protein